MKNPKSKIKTLAGISEGQSGYYFVCSPLLLTVHQTHGVVLGSNLVEYFRLMVSSVHVSISC